MPKIIRRHQKALMAIGLILLLAAIVWAAAELSGQANSMAQDAGSNSAELEMITLDTLKKPSRQPPPCDWQKEKELRHKIAENDAKYKELIAKTKSEVKSSGKVTEPTQDEVLGQANAYNDLQDQYSSMWGACKCKTRANLATKLGTTRIKSAAVVVSEIDQEKLDEMNAAQEEMKAARREYAQKAAANDELSEEDKKDIQANVIPQINNMMTTMMKFIQEIAGLMNEVQQSAQKMTSGKDGAGGLFGAAKSMSSTGTGLFKKVQTLSTVANNMSKNVQDTMSDAQTLIGSSVPTGSSSSGGTGLPRDSSSPPSEDWLDRFKKSLEEANEEFKTIFGIDQTSEGEETITSKPVKEDSHVPDKMEKLPVTKKQEKRTLQQEKLSKLSVESNVIGTTVLVNGKEIGKTPLSDVKVASGKQIVEVISDEYEPYKKPIHFEKDRGIFLYVDLIKKTKRKGKLFVQTDPNNTRIRILNIVPRFKQGMDLLPGKYHIEVSASGYSTKKRWIQLREGNDVFINIVLEPMIR